MKTVLSPKALGEAIGVSESSLKRWADDGRLEVARTAGGHRRIRRNEAIRFIREHGFAVERPDVLDLDEVPPGRPGEPVGSRDETMHRTLVDGDADRALAIAVSRYLDGPSLAAIVDDLLAPSLRAIGDRWPRGPDGILVEHRATDVCTQVLSRLRGLAPRGPGRPVAVGAAPPGDPYTLPSLMAATVLAGAGWAEINLSAETPEQVLVRAAAGSRARLVWLALSVEATAAQVAGRVRHTRDRLRDAGCRAQLAVGGPALRALRPPAVDGVHFVSSMRELAAFAGGLKAGRG